MADAGVGEAAVAEGAKGAGEAAAIDTSAATAAEAGTAGAVAAGAAETGGAAAATSAGGAAAAGTGSLTGSALGDLALVQGGTAVATSMLAPKPPTAGKAIPMPDPLAQEQAKRQAVIEQMARRGRASTILTSPGNSLGG